MITAVVKEWYKFMEQWIKKHEFYYTWLTKPTKWHVRPTKTQISLGIHPVRSESSLSAWRKHGSSAIHWAHSEDSDQTGRMPRLIWVFAGRTNHFVGFVTRRLILFYHKIACNIMCMKTLYWSKYEPPHDKANNVAVRPSKTQISLGIRPVWSEYSLSAWRKIGSLDTHWAHSEDSDQTGRMPRLIWVFAGRTIILLVLPWGGSIMIYQNRYEKGQYMIGDEFRRYMTSLHEFATWIYILYHAPCLTLNFNFVVCNMYLCVFDCWNLMSEYCYV